MEAQAKEIRLYITSEGKIPFTDWLEALPDQQARGKIKARLKRVTLGNLGDYKTVGLGVCELRINYGSGYRIYFRIIGSTIILLLCGGDKSTQTKDINTAQQYWRDYDKRTNIS
ncbi:type II toxin-antitoxin system RelE/ParE family toxin [Aphanothece sacrum]|uniref:Addiction module killer protein n=1 Tax=Aphanothece sacrum FPU1 TaxID=1920663 RepID=A0A401IJJ6_APHSA|nr:type II toxin-antitoxin system RelE/ParE family toxin [Aphanothece sacrum]GBF81386.1 addiction module killer protein [Aphanothece sacrum FPU1]GBF85423.1 addiction module protein [Aphanothece sacrum FPU3]